MEGSIGSSIRFHLNNLSNGKFLEYLYVSLDCLVGSLVESSLVELVFFSSMRGSVRVKLSSNLMNNARLRCVPCFCFVNLHPLAFLSGKYTFMLPDENYGMVLSFLDKKTWKKRSMDFKSSHVCYNYKSSTRNWRL